MKRESLYNVAKRYVDLIEEMERTADRERLLDLEEERILRHDKLLEIMKREDLPFRDREHVARWEYFIVKGLE